MTDEIREKALWRPIAEAPKDGSWIVAIRDEEGLDNMHRMTHWMPLPAPPEVG